MKQRNVFRRIILLIICLFVPILGVYTYSNYRTQADLTTQIESLNMSHSLFFVNQLESRLERLKESAMFMTHDDDVNQFIYFNLLNEGNRVLLKQSLLEKLMFMNTNNDWNDWIALIYPRNDMRIYANFSGADSDVYTEIPKAAQGWQLEELTAGPMKKPFFIWNLAFPYTSQDVNYSPQLVVQVGISVDTIIDMLKQFKNEQQGEAFLYSAGQQTLIGGQLPDETVAQWEERFDSEASGDQGSLTMTAGGTAYLVNYIRVQSVGWYLVTMTPSQQIYEPIERGMVIFYVTLILLLLFAVLAGYLIFRHVQIPVGQMLKVVRRFEKGEYSVRLEIGREHDFSYLFKSFNRMAATIQELIERVYLEQIRSREATLKQLQSQINPHFLYNSLYFVESMIHLDNREAASDMVMNLSKYFRYATYADKRPAALAEELKVVESYLRIHNLRNKRFRYRIEVPDDMMGIEVPRLILQPIVENAMIYGVEAKEGEGIVHVTGFYEGGGWRIAVDDNGPGIDEEKRERLKADWKLTEPESTESCGMYNVNQRLHLQYGEGAGLEIAASPEGGCRIILKLGDRLQEGDLEK